MCANLVTALEHRDGPPSGCSTSARRRSRATIVKLAGELMRASGLNFHGYVEGDDIYKGTTDVVVCDGFVGNVTLKTSEGLAQMMAHLPARGVRPQRRWPAARRRSSPGRLIAFSVASTRAATTARRCSGCAASWQSHGSADRPSSSRAIAARRATEAQSGILERIIERLAVAAARERRRDAQVRADRRHRQLPPREGPDQPRSRDAVDTSDEWIVSRTGIRQRHIADERADDERSRARGERGGARGRRHRAPGISISSSSPRPRPTWCFPSTACILQAKLGVHGLPGVRRPGRVQRLRLRARRADQFMRTGQYRNALWSAPRCSRASSTGTTAPPASCSATAREPWCCARTTEPGMLASMLHADGSARGTARGPGQPSAAGSRAAAAACTMDGPGGVQVRGARARRGRGETRRRDCGMQIGDIDWLIPHQANIRIIEATAKRLGLAAEKLVVTVDRHANTSAASIPLALDRGGARRAHPARPQGDARGRRRRFHLGRGPWSRFEGATMKFGIVFPGQGSQSVGMIAGYGDAPEVRRGVSRPPRKC